MALVAFIGVNGVDALLTALAVLFMGAVEANPFLGSIALSHGVEKMLLIKVLFSIALGGALWERRALRTLRVVNWILAAVVMYNGLIITYAVA